ncbi:glycosyltransferase family 2 protein [Paraprevotella clara]|jgi:glycosyltransferase involved in cell wall biosynthesis|uniref:glycosyltransferase family 2 protein n=1 Tax=Paraprevotella clara TaxID=454154 RepID=UPI00266EE51B|nr:glycosyltransferase family A protein [Paraprevotella clara]
MENTPSFAVTEGPLVTLVVPMYNVAPYLERCLRSLEKQTYRNIEVIIMDDCSTDGSLDIASKMAASDMRFKVFSMPRNSGAGDARQAAIEKSSGEFVGFVDADDYVDVDFVALLYGLITKTGADVACCQHYFYDEAHQRLTTPWAYDDKIVCLSPCEAMRKMKSYDQMDEGLWNKLCRREIVVRHRMETFPFEDAFVLYKYIPEAESVALCCVPLYYYYQRDGSLMHTDYTPYKAFARYKLEILKDKAIRGTERLETGIALYYIRKGLRLLREFGLLGQAADVSEACRGVLECLHEFDYVSDMELGGKDLIARRCVYKRLWRYLELNRKFVATFRKRKMEKVCHKYSLQTMEVFQKGL